MIKEDLSPVAPNFNPWLEIWYRPRATIRRIIQVDPKRDIYLIAALFGYVQYLDRVTQQAWGDQQELLPILGLGLVLGPIGGLIGLSVATFIFGFTARRLGGEGDNDDTAAAIAWSQVPTIFTLVLWLIQILIFRRELFMSESSMIQSTPELSFIFVPILAISVVIGLWQAVMTVLTMAEVHRFAIWRAVLTLVLPSVVVLMLIVAVLAVR